MSAMNTHDLVDVVICGAGPNGLMLAGELALGGVRPLVLDALPELSNESRASAVTGQVVRFLDMRGLYPDLAGEPGPPKPVPSYIFSGLPLHLAELPANPMFGIAIPQPELARQLLDRAQRLGARVRWGHRVVDLARHEDRVRLTISGPRGDYRLDARFLVGADGGTSTVRKLAGIGFPGHTSTAVTRLGHVSLPDRLRVDGGLEVPGAGHFAFGHNRLERGMFVYSPLEPDRPVLAVQEFDAPSATDEPMTLDELRAALRRVLGVDLPIDPPTGPGPHALRRITGQNTRQAERYREGPILLIGDAAHVYAGIGAPGLNLGLQDAANLGWKLAGQLAGWAPTGLLDTYHAERHPVGERVAMSTLAQTALMLPGPEIGSLRRVFGELLQTPQTVQQIADLMAGTDIRYGTEHGHSLSGLMVPEATISTGGRTLRVAELLRGARPVLLDLTGEHRPGAALDGWSDRLDVVSGVSSDLPGAAAVLVRPDGYVTWATDDAAEIELGLPDALAEWFGAPKVLAG